MDFDKIKPLFNISDKYVDIINEINKKLENINISDASKKKDLIKKSRVRSIYSSLSIEANSLSLEVVSNIVDNKLVLGKRKEVQEVKNTNELYQKIKEFDWTSELDLIKSHMTIMKYFDDDKGHIVIMERL